MAIYLYREYYNKFFRLKRTTNPRKKLHRKLVTQIRIRKKTNIISIN